MGAPAMTHHFDIGYSILISLFGYSGAVKASYWIQWAWFFAHIVRVKEEVIDLRPEWRIR
jgi:hypothetical protein